MLQTISKLVELADGGHPLAAFSYAKEAFDNLKDGGYNYLPQTQRDALFNKIMACFNQSAKQGVSSAMFYLGMIHLEGRHV